MSARLIPLVEGGRIINVASLLSCEGGYTVTAYAAPKGGISPLTKALSNGWARKGIAVDAVDPGYIATDLDTALTEDQDERAGILPRVPAGRWGTSRRTVKGPAVFLASGASGYPLLPYAVK